MSVDSEEIQDIHTILYSSEDREWFCLGQEVKWLERMAEAF
jgi:hypothetical protein